MNTQKIYKLARFQRKVLIGILLGDAHLETQNQGRTYRLVIEKSLAHKDYVTHLYNVFKDFVRTPPKPRLGKRKNNVGFRTVSHGCFRYYGKLFYKDGKKVIPSNIGKYLNNVSVAYWYMDDGSRQGPNRSGKVFSTEGLLKEEVMLLCASLKNLGFGANVHLQRRNKILYKNEGLTFRPRNGNHTSYYGGSADPKVEEICEITENYRIYITSKSDPIFTEYIKPHIDKSMEYKL